ncbi:NAD(P)H dehydrogenase [Acetobacterium paludosum]|uniref:NAD(P)H dehydrogenase n=1 Tax=Acetobacterium paludosum TaxID=52693 RepID=A0A923HTA0_9FIRM|nr:NAD(P)H-dependent oxidoreductase [Acetobacterium paludosum]MBC3887926.1 NAD(P)H dehydrogenase [Acetobacterium paludosum]
MMKNLLFVNACVRGSESRTKKLCDEFIKWLNNKEEYQIDECNLECEKITPMKSESLIRRNQLLEVEKYTDEMFIYAKKFAEADSIVVGAPYWDLSFPALIKVYFEAVSVCGITFQYGADGIPMGMCHAEKLYYVTSCGGFIGNFNFGYDYIKGLSMLYGIKNTEMIAAEGLDIIGMDVDAQMSKALERTKKL